MIKAQMKNGHITSIIFDIVGVLFDYPDNFAQEIKDPSGFIPIQATIDLLPALSDYNLYIISNMSEQNLDYLYEQYPTIMNQFTGVVISACGYKKPDSQIFHHFLKKYHLIPHECVFIDDKAANVQAACAIGIESILFDRVTIQHDLVRLLNK